MSTTTSRTSRWAAVLGGFGRILNRLEQMRVRRSVVFGLASFDDHLLRDIGLTRADVDAALVEPRTTDATVVLAARAQEHRQHQRAQARDAHLWLSEPQKLDRRAA